MYQSIPFIPKKHDHKKMFKRDRYLNYRPLLFPFFLPSPSWEIRNYLLVQTISSTIFKNNLFASKKHQCIKLSEEMRCQNSNLLEKKEARISVKQLAAIRPSNSSISPRMRIFDPVPPTRPGIITREPRYRLPNSRVNLRRDDRRGEGEREEHGCELLDIRNKGMPPNYSRTVSYAALVTKVT